MSIAMSERKKEMLASVGFDPSVKSSLDNGERNEVTCVLVGDGACGKTTLLHSFVSHRIPPLEEPQLREKFSIMISLEPKNYSLTLWDTAGQDDNYFQPECYKQADVFFLLFSAISHPSLENIESKWFPKLQSLLDRVPFVLVATKTDLRNDPETQEMLKERGLNFVSREEGLAMAKRIGAKAYLECSARTHEGVKETFEKAIKVVLNPGKEGVILENSKAKKDKLRTSKCIMV